MTLILALACAPKGAGDDPPASGDGGGAVVATVSADYTVGALATVDPEDWSVADQLAGISADPAVRAQDGLVFVLGRYQTDSVRIYEVGSWTAPRVEFSVGDRANPMDAAACGDRLFVTLGNRDYMGIYDLGSGDELGRVDLSAWDDGDGSPEAAEVVPARGMDGRLYVALEQLDQAGGWLPAGGTVVEVDCDAAAVTREWDVGPNPSVHPWPGEDGLVMVRTGAWYDADGEIDLDGGLSRLDVATDTLTHSEVTEAELGVTLTDVAVAFDGTALVLSADEDWAYETWCLDLDGWTLTSAGRTGAFLADVAGDGQGDAWVAARPGWSDAGAPTGIAVWDVAACAQRNPGDLVETSLPPVSIAFY